MEKRPKNQQSPPQEEKSHTNYVVGSSSSQPSSNRNTQQMSSSNNNNNNSSSKSSSKDGPQRGYELCPRCGKIVHYSSFGRHMREVHGGEKKYRCTVEGCGATFHRATVLQEHHAVVHTGVKRYKCQHCDKEYFHSSHLSRHVTSKHGSKKAKK